MSENGGTVRGCPAWVKVLLVLSLVANMVILGLYVGQMSKPKRERGAERQIGWIVKFVPEAKRDAAETLFDAKRDDIRKSYRERSKHLELIVEAIRAEPYAPETLIAAMRDRRENSNARRLIIEDTLVELLADFTPEERAHFAAQMEARMKGRKGGGK